MKSVLPIAKHHLGSIAIRWSARRLRVLHGLVLALVATTALPFLTACAKTKTPPPKIEPAVSAPNPLPRFLRGTIRYEADLEGYGLGLANGYGIMVGLNGTGSNDIPIPVRTMLEQEAAKRLETTRIGGPEQFSIRQLLDSPNTAVVVVEGLIPAGATKGAKFDLLVRALPGTSTTSLEGGILWTTLLRIDPIGEYAGHVLDPLANGRGDIFINPFADAMQGTDGRPRTSVDKLTGRILNGGTLTQNMKLFLHLRTPNYSRSRAITNAINARFPIEYGQRAATAVPVPGQADERIDITVPSSWYGKSDQFVEVLMHMPIYQAGSEARADGLVRWLVENPVDAPSISWCFVGIGQKSLQPIQRLYDYPELTPRLCALKAGAKLNDPLTVQHLITIAEDRQNEFRIEAIELLTGLSTNPRSMATLLNLVSDDDRNVQIAAFEGLRQNLSPAVQRYALGEKANFALFSVPSNRPMIYVHQQGEPIVVVFGYDLKIQEPLLASAWDNRFMIMSDDSDEPLRVFFENPKTGKANTYEPSSTIPAFVRFLARREAYLGDEPGLEMNYAQTIGVLYALHQQNALGGPLVLQQDRIRSTIDRTRGTQPTEVRPETNRVVDDGPPIIPNRPESSNSENRRN